MANSQEEQDMLDEKGSSGGPSSPPPNVFSGDHTVAEVLAGAPNRVGPTQRIDSGE